VSACKSFPSEFYVTCATVIPVLYLALVVQSNAYETMLRNAVRAARTQARRAALRPLVFAYFAVAAGLVGEALALVVLCIGSDTEIIRVDVLINTLGMVAVAGAGPTVRWLRSVREVTRDLRGIRRPDISKDD
jgi:hypothetical protein